MKLMLLRQLCAVFLRRRAPNGFDIFFTVFVFFCFFKFSLVVILFYRHPDPIPEKTRIGYIANPPELPRFGSSVKGGSIPHIRASTGCASSLLRW